MAVKPMVDAAIPLVKKAAVALAGVAMKEGMKLANDKFNQYQEKKKADNETKA